MVLKIDKSATFNVRLLFRDMGINIRKCSQKEAECFSSQEGTAWGQETSAFQYKPICTS